jgi:hypothetical protein
MVRSTFAPGLRLASAVTVANVLVAGGFSVAGLVRPEAVLPGGMAPTGASFIFALYAAARTLPLAVITLIAVQRRSAPALLVLGVLAGAVQLLDAGVGLVQHDLGKSIGPLVIAALQFLATARLNRSMRPAGS